MISQLSETHQVACGASIQDYCTVLTHARKLAPLNRSQLLSSSVFPEDPSSCTRTGDSIDMAEYGGRRGLSKTDGYVPDPLPESPLMGQFDAGWYSLRRVKQRLRTLARRLNHTQLYFRLFLRRNPPSSFPFFFALRYAARDA